jgi:isopenicillin N synthase-like dioxygenase
MGAPRPEPASATGATYLSLRVSRMLSMAEVMFPGHQDDLQNQVTTSDEIGIPIIDIGDLHSAAGIEHIAVQIRAACQGIGFFYITNHPVSDGLLAEAFEANRYVHRLPAEEKQRIKLNAWHRGYQALASSKLTSSARFAPARYANQLESFFIRQEVPRDHPSFERRALHGPNQWPADAWFRDVVTRYDSAVRELGLALLAPFSVAVGEDPDFFGRFFDPPSTTLRLIHYPPAPAVRPEDLFGIHPHTDYGFLTILAQDDVGGLQLRRVDGAWIPAPYVAGSFILNIGDALARWTNDRFNSTPHRVINQSAFTDRYSIALFFDPNLDATVECLPRFATAAEPARYEPIRYEDYYTMRLDTNYPDRASAPAPAQAAGHNSRNANH